MTAHISDAEHRLRAALAWVAWTMNDRIVAQLLGAGDGFTFEPGTALLWEPAGEGGTVRFWLSAPVAPFTAWALNAQITRPGHEDGDIEFAIAVPSRIVDQRGAAWA